MSLQTPEELALAMKQGLLRLDEEIKEAHPQCVASGTLMTS